MPKGLPVDAQAIHSPYASGWRASAIPGILHARSHAETEEQPMLSAAIDFWLLPATIFFDAFLPARKPASAVILPLPPIAQRIRRKRKIVRSKRGN